jgi:transcriptional regulator with XRE-family HTH domain
MTQLDKRDRSTLFRTRLAEAMDRRGSTQSALARDIGVDRSTVSQLLKSDGSRLPNAQVVAECAAALGVSADWLLGLTERPELAADLLAASMEISAAPRARIDEQLDAWHREAAGYKIRHVPPRLPDMLKTPEMLRWEYEPHLGKTTVQAITAAEDRLAFMRASLSDTEIALPLFEVNSLVDGEGYYKSCPAEVRAAQVARLLDLHEQLYPNLRIFLYDGRALFAGPMTIFGPLMAVLYIGQLYLAFRDSERVGAFTRAFDQIVREATVSARAFPDYVRDIHQVDEAGGT